MLRYPHYWWQLKGKSFPSRIAVMECDGVEDEAGGIGVVRGEKLVFWRLLVATLRDGRLAGIIAYSGTTAPGAWRRLGQLLSSRDTTWLFCSPASRILGLLDFWPMLSAGDLELAGKDWRAPEYRENAGEDRKDGVCIIEDPPTVISCRPPDRPGKLLILDIRNWGIDLLPGGMTAHERAEKYLAGILSCVQTLRQGDRCGLRCTAAGQAVSFLRSAPDCVQLHCHTFAGALALERAAYYGGRCECYRIGDIPGEVYHVDVRSMYPALCRTLHVPTSIRRYYGAKDAYRAADRAGQGAVAADVTIQCAVPAYPFRLRGNVVYPVGVYRTHLCGTELADAVSEGHVTRWHDAAEYNTTPALAGFYGWWLDRLDTARAAGNAMAVQWIKRVMNALVGKFGEPGRRWVPSPARPEHGDNGVWTEGTTPTNTVRYRNIGRYTQREEINGESYWSIPAIAAWITAAGRSRLWDYYKTAGRENVWYVDTDSLLTNRIGFDRLLSGGFVRDGETGYLRLVGSHKRCAVYGIRHYLLDNTVSCAGVPRGAIEPGESREHYFLRSAIAADVAMGRQPAAERVELSYPKPEKYRHGRVMKDGSVLPLEIDDG